MSTQHTPGEWRISGISQEDGSISIAKNQIVICYVTNAASIFEVVLQQTPETQFANARLIAAAPDMYEALKHEAEWHEAQARTHKTLAQRNPGMVYDGLKEAWHKERAEALRAVLAKAEVKS